MQRPTATTLRAFLKECLRHAATKPLKEWLTALAKGECGSSADVHQAGAKPKHKPRWKVTKRPKGPRRPPKVTDLPRKPRPRKGK